MMIKITKNKYIEIEKKLKELTLVEREKIAATLKIARAHGDLKENAEYAEAKRRQGELEEKISILEQRLRDAEIITEKLKLNSLVNIGSVVEVNDGKKNVKYEIVPTEDSDIMTNKISNESPMGMSLIGSKVGDTVKIRIPDSKNITLKIKKIE